MIGDRYRLEGEIGRGGSSSVWLGHDEVLGRAVALKRLGLSPGESEPDAERAEREAHVAARIHHAHVVAVYDLVDDGDHQWLVMEHVPGTTLAQLCATSPLPPERAARLLAQVADGLAAAHAHGIVHRDVKPSNVLVTPDDVAKLSDFGIARRDQDAILTRTGLITGSPAYLAPEVARGRTASSASDVWAFGATTFHACTGAPPFPAGDGDASALAAVQRIIDDTTPSLATTHPLASIVAATMRRDPAARPTMQEVADRLQEIVAPGTKRKVGLLELLQQNSASSTETAGTPEDPAPTVAAPAQPAHAGDEATPPPGPADELAAPVLPPASHAAPTPRRTALWLVAAAAAVVVGGTAVVMALSGGDDAPTASPAVSSSAAPSTGSAEPTPQPSGPTAAALEDFATDYLDAAGNDPSIGYSMLTPTYQQASGGLTGYQGFWDRVTNIQLRRVAADVDRMRVTYIYSYDIDGRQRTETVTLQLEQDGDRLLIADADSI